MLNELEIWKKRKAETLRKLAIGKLSAMQRCREKCKDCSYWQFGEISACEQYSCPLWPVRKGRLDKESLKKQVEYVSSKV